MIEQNDTLASILSPLDVENPKQDSTIYEYNVPRLGNKKIRFPNEEPDVSEMIITHIDMDPTEVCNLRCSYCFKGKLAGKDMSLETAKQSVRFLVKYSGSCEDIGISLLGGEPLLAFSLLKKWVPWAHRYCEQRKKTLRITATTNGTIFDQEHHDFFRAWDIGLHLSIDGAPKVQDQNRVFADGKGSSKKLEENLPRIFSAWRTIHARSTIVPENVCHLYESYKYFCDKGFYKVAFALADSDGWNNSKVLNELEIQFQKVLQYHWKHMKVHNQYYLLSYLGCYVERKDITNNPTPGCGAGRGSLHVDIDGNLWHAIDLLA